MEVTPGESLKGDVDNKAREPVYRTCAAIEIEIPDSDLSQDHVHVVTSAPTKRTPAEIVGQMGRAS